MKKASIIIWCFLYIFLVCACKNGDSSNPSGTADAAASSQSTGSAATSEPKDSYKEIACEKVTAFQEVSFLVSDSRTQVQIMFPKNWTLKKSDEGYSILQQSKVIGSVTASDAVGSETAENVYKTERMMSGVDISNRIDRMVAEGQTQYVRTLSYSYKETEGGRRTITITVPYQQIDDEAIWTMMVKVKRHTASDPQMGVLPLEGNRKNVLILGNSFVASSKIGSILQKMCGTSLRVEAQSRGYARVTTYVQDGNMMNSIRSGEYAAVILCGLYDSDSLTNLEHMVNACASSNTKLAIFPAHNENRSLITFAEARYPSIVMLDWKEEIENLISVGIDETHFCIADSHKHSTPLAGYVGAHMIYRAIFGKVPAETAFSEVSKAEIARLGEYASTGSVALPKPDATYPMKAD